MIVRIPEKISFAPDNVIFYDSGCGLCGRTVDYVRGADKKNFFELIPLNSPMADDLMRNTSLRKLKIDSVIYLKNNTFFLKSDAVIEIMFDLYKYRNPIKLFKIFPAFIRDGIYDFIARDRNKWFPRTDSCSV